MVIAIEHTAVLATVAQQAPMVVVNPNTGSGRAPALRPPSIRREPHRLHQRPPFLEVRLQQRRQLAR
jgi:hypothetical protein